MGSYIEEKKTDESLTCNSNVNVNKSNANNKSNKSNKCSPRNQQEKDEHEKKKAKLFSLKNDSVANISATAIATATVNATATSTVPTNATTNAANFTFTNTGNHNGIKTEVVPSSIPFQSHNSSLFPVPTAPSLLPQQQQQQQQQVLMQHQVLAQQQMQQQRQQVQYSQSQGIMTMPVAVVSPQPNLNFALRPASNITDNAALLTNNNPTMQQSILMQHAATSHQHQHIQLQIQQQQAAAAVAAMNMGIGMNAVIQQQRQQQQQQQQVPTEIATAMLNSHGHIDANGQIHPPIQQYPTTLLPVTATTPVIPLHTIPVTPTIPTISSNIPTIPTQILPPPNLIQLPNPNYGLTIQDHPQKNSVYNGVNPNYPNLNVINQNPPIFTVDNFLTHTECDFLINVSQDCFSPAPVVGKGAGEVSSSRTSSTCYLAREDLPNYLRKVCALTGKPMDHCELPQVGRYFPSQQYLQHFDAFDLSNEDGIRFASNGGQRTVTILVYLNDVQRGGHTSFPNLNIEIKPKRGMALVFFPSTVDGLLDKNVLHAAKPAIDTKYVSQVWIRQGRYEGVPSKRMFSSVDQAMIVQKSLIAAREGGEHVVNDGNGVNNNALTPATTPTTSSGSNHVVGVGRFM